MITMTGQRWYSHHSMHRIIGIEYRSATCDCIFFRTEEQNDYDGSTSINSKVYPVVTCDKHKKIIQEAIVKNRDNPKIMTDVDLNDKVTELED